MSDLSKRPESICYALLCLVCAVLAGAVISPVEALAGPAPGIGRGVEPGPFADSLSLHPCELRTRAGRFAAECGELQVRESADPAVARVISLPVMRVRALEGGSAEPLFWLAGGPGQSNMDFRPSLQLLAERDVVMVGYRGVDGSSVLVCPEVRHAMRGTGGDLLGAQSLDRMRGAFAACLTRLADEGIDLDAYTMVDVVRDMEAAREALGYSQINLLSASYGTRVAQIYAHQHPQIIHRSAMLAVNPPGRFVWEAGMIDHQLEYYSELCALDAACSARTSDLAGTMRRVNADMPRRWLFVPIDPGKVRVASFALLFNRATAAQVFDAYLAADEGDPSGLALMSLAYDLTIPSMFVWGDMALKGATADCDPARDYDGDMDPPGAIMGSPFSRLLWASLPCSQLRLIAPEFREVQPSSVETLLLVGSVDFSTPAQYAIEDLLPHLSNGRLVQLSEQGHVADLFSAQRPATSRMLAAFYAAGEVDETLHAHTAMDFSASPGFALIAKAAAATLGLLILILAALIWGLFRLGVRLANRPRA
ncbi:alpha/beta hydrolase [Glycocaulis sp.]|uniref:alpha/beta fold hydrolase n=1 Tax=Glycocaulis sp. TaxID=1969725 RepID=UPI003D23ED0B